MTARKPAPVIDNSDRNWHWDRKVPIALIVTIVLAFGGQTCAGVWWASKADSRIDALERQSNVSAPMATDQGTRLTRVEVKLDNLADGMNEIKAILRREQQPLKNR